MNSKLQKLNIKLLAPTLSRLGRKKAFIACTPKSASTYLMRMLSEILQARITTFISAYDRTEQDINLSKVIESSFFSTVTHQHMKCSDYNLSVLKKFRIKPVILTRNIYDSIISMKNHMHNEPDNTWWPMAYIDETFYDKSDSEQLDFIIEFFVPWYINFYVSWYKASKTDSLLWITYDNLISNKVDTVNKVLKYYNFNRTLSEEGLLKIEENIFSSIRFNKGNSGRGEKLLTEKQRGKVDSFIGHYPTVDFTKIL